MIGLKVTQQANDGRKKVWKLSQQQTQLTFGTSRKANLISIDSEAAAYDLVLEFRNSGWHCIRFNTNENSADQLLMNGNKIELPNSVLSFELIEKKEFILSQIEKLETFGNVKKNLVVITHNNQIISSSLLDTNQPFYLYSDGCKQEVKIPFSQKWNDTRISNFVIKSREVSLNSVENLSQLDKKNMLDSESKKSLLITLGLGFAIISISLLMPRSQSKNLTQTVTPKTINTIVKTDIKKRKQQSSNQISATNQKPAPANTSGGDNKAAALVKSAIGLRISQLLGKVSATEARSKNLVLTAKGVKAGEANAGRALAALGKVESSGRDWVGETSVKGSGVGTAGFGGGNGSKGFAGGLSQGKTGSGGVGLIEEESEISGGLDREIIAQYIKTQLGQILYCYERQLSASPELFGKIAVRFTIAGTGQVETQTINDTTLKNTSVENCILNKISKWKFPEPKGGTKVLVTYPFLFKSTN